MSWVYGYAWSNAEDNSPHVPFLAIPFEVAT
jgi:hypothetical protein